MADEVTSQSTLSGDSNVWRALNPKHLEEGLPGDNHFVMKASHAVGDGVSLGISSLISLDQLRELTVIHSAFGEKCAVAELNVAQMLAPVSTIGITVLQSDAPEWDSFAQAHAVLTGYQVLQGNAGKRQIRDYQRHLVKLARKKYYPVGKNEAALNE